MVTLSAAKVLGRDHAIGSLTQGKLADWISLPWNGSEKEVFNEIVNTPSTPEKVIIGGKTVIKKQR